MKSAARGTDDDQATAEASDGGFAGFRFSDFSAISALSASLRFSDGARS
jgi:hypothetical protein